MATKPIKPTGDFATFTDVDGHPISIRKCAVLAVGSSQNANYSSWVVVGSTPSGDSRYFLKDTAEEVLSKVNRC